MALNSTIFSVLHVYTRSVLAHNNTNKLDEIELLATEYNFAVVCLTETWLDNSIDNVTVYHIKRRLSGNLPKYRPPAHDIFVDRCTIYSYFTSNANRWAPGRMFSSKKYEHFVQVSSYQKHIYNVIWRTVWSVEHFKATMVSSNGPLAQSLCEPGRALRRITPIHLRNSSNSVIAACDLFAACQQCTSMEI